MYETELMRTTISRITSSLKRSQLSVDNIRPALWNDAVDESSYTESSEKYRSAIMDQYKIYVEMTDRISARRSATNTFFLLLNTGVFATIWSFAKSPEPSKHAAFALASAMLVLQCVAWHLLLRSYRQLVSAKFRVIAALEERLPASPWFRAEWTAVGAGRDKPKYWPVTSLEQWVPTVFGIAYAGLFVIAARG